MRCILTCHSVFNISNRNSIVNREYSIYSSIMILGEKIAVLMHREGFTQPSLSKELGVAQTTISAWIRGVNRPGKRSIMKLSECFDVDANMLDDDSIDLPNWEPAEKVKKMFPSEFGQHLQQINEEAEQYVVGEESFENAVMKKLNSLSAMLEQVLENFPEKK